MSLLDLFQIHILNCFVLIDCNWCNQWMISYIHYVWVYECDRGIVKTSTISVYVGCECHWGILLYTSSICGVWGMIIYLHYMWGVGLTGGDYIPPLYVGSRSHWGWLYTSTICGVWVSPGGMIMYLHYMWGVSVTGGEWLYTSTICGVWVSLGEGVIIYLHYMWGVSITGGNDYIPPLYVGSRSHWGWLYTSTICGE